MHFRTEITVICKCGNLHANILKGASAGLQSLMKKDQAPGGFGGFLSSFPGAVTITVP